MRARISRALLERLERRTPGWVRRIQYQLLLNLTARAFHVRGKYIWQYPEGRALREYAAFTVQCMERNNAEPEELFDRAYALGERVRILSGMRERRDLERLVFCLYRNIGITMTGRLPGEVTIPRCYFSQCYTPQNCALMSYEDSGFIAGIFGGGRLCFSQRLTDGCAACKAEFNQ